MPCVPEIVTFIHNNIKAKFFPSLAMAENSKKLWHQHEIMAQTWKTSFAAHRFLNTLNATFSINWENQIFCACCDLSRN
jgi:hypothetical protein